MTTFLIIVSAYYLLTTKTRFFTRRTKAVIGVLCLLILIIAYSIYSA
ncbi:hypothetical protein [Photobacterium satsumensis]